MGRHYRPDPGDVRAGLIDQAAKPDRPAGSDTRLTGDQLPLAPDDPDEQEAARRLVRRLAPDDADLMLDALGLA